MFIVGLAVVAVCAEIQNEVQEVNRVVNDELSNKVVDSKRNVDRSATTHPSLGLVENESINSFVPERTTKVDKAPATTGRTKATRRPRPSTVATTPKVDPDAYVQPKNKEDGFDWRLSQV